MSGSKPYPVIGLQNHHRVISTDDLPCYEQNKRASPNRRKMSVMQRKIRDWLAGPPILEKELEPRPIGAANIRTGAKKAFALLETGVRHAITDSKSSTYKTHQIF